jgi:YfiR/HmsC-like
VSPRSSWHIKHVQLLALGLCLIALRLNAGPQVNSSESSLRVAFVFSIAKFIEWPEAEYSGTLKMCAVNTLPDTQTALAQLNGKVVQGKPVEIVLLSASQVRANHLAECRLLYQEMGSDIAFG